MLAPTVTRVASAMPCMARAATRLEVEVPSPNWPDELSPQLSAEDQVFVAAFVRSHGSIKEMEQVFGVSYPTIKARLNRVAASLEFVETDPQPGRAEVLDRLARGEITADRAIADLEGRS